MFAYLEEHVSRFDPSVSSHGSSLHDGADVNAAVSPIVTLPNDADAQKVVLLCQMRKTTVKTPNRVLVCNRRRE